MIDLGLPLVRKKRWAPKQFDARVIAVGRRLFAFAIRAGNPESYIDFRADYDALTYEPIELPADVADGIRRLLETMGLVYGALDFVVSPDGSFAFLECNSGGQFGWLEARTGAPLTDALADLLAQGLLAQGLLAQGDHRDRLGHVRRRTG